jgi:methionine synthase II (cobalamin-independent)
LVITLAQANAAVGQPAPAFTATDTSGKTVRLADFKGKTVVLGLVTTKFGEMESKDALKRRIEEAAKYAPLDQLALSPQCGFSSTVHGNNIAVQAQRDKLRLVIETTQEVWGEA